MHISYFYGTITTLSGHNSVDWFRFSDSYIHQWNMLLLVEILAKPMLTNCQLDHKEHIQWKYIFHLWKFVWKCCLQNGGHFVKWTLWWAYGCCYVGLPQCVIDCYRYSAYIITGNIQQAKQSAMTCSLKMNGSAEGYQVIIITGSLPEWKNSPLGCFPMQCLWFLVWVSMSWWQLTQLLIGIHW